VILYGVDASYPNNVTLAALDAMSNPPPSWVLVYVGGPTNGGHWTVSDKTDRESRYQTVPCYVGQNDLQHDDGSIYHVGTYTPEQGVIDARDALQCFTTYGYPTGAYWLDTEYISYHNSGAPVLDYIDAFHQVMHQAGYSCGQYGSAEMLEAYKPSVPVGAAVAQWFETMPATLPLLSAIPLSTTAQSRYSWRAWQFFNRGGYDVSVADERMFPAADWSRAQNRPPTHGLPGQTYQLSDGSTARFFPDTGYSIAYGFRSFWETYGVPEPGMLLFGYPISREYMRLFPSGEAYTCQMFERARLEWHPNSDSVHFDVELGLIGNLVVERTNEAQTYPAAFVKEHQPA
jgi:hypothetical protein